MLVYLAGPMTGKIDFNRAAFATASERLRRQGYSVFNPAAANLERLPLNAIMAYVIEQLCYSEAIALLPGWWKSGGARIEWLLAKYLKKKIIYLR